MTRTHDDGPEPRRRASPFDDGFLTIWPRESEPGGTGPDDDRAGLLPDVNPADGGTSAGVTPSDDEPVDIAAEALRDDEAVAERDVAHARLRPALRALESIGLYAYITLDDENRWVVASDDEAGRVDIGLEGDDFEVVMTATSPGMYADEEQVHRRRSLERLARMLVPRIAQGQLADHQKAWWDETEAGVSVQVRYLLPRDEPEAIAPFVREHFEELEELLIFIEEQVSR